MTINQETGDLDRAENLDKENLAFLDYDFIEEAKSRSFRREIKFLKTVALQGTLYFDLNHIALERVLNHEESRHIWLQFRIVASRSRALNYDLVSTHLRENLYSFGEDQGEKLFNCFTYALPLKEWELENFIKLQQKKYKKLTLKSMYDTLEGYIETEHKEYAIDYAEKMKELVLDSFAPESNLLDAKTCIKEWIEYHLMLTPDQDGVIGVRTGFPKLDKMTMGFKAGDLVIIGASTSVGKSALMTSMISNITTNNPVAFYSLEMSKEQIFDRLLSIVSRVTLSDIMSKRYERFPELNERMNRAIKEVESRQIYACDVTNSTVNSIKASLRIQKNNNPNLKICFIDYLQYIQDHTRRGINTNTHSYISELTCKLKQTAKELDMCIVLLSQLNRKVADQDEPTLANLKESGNIEQDADIVILIHKPKPQKKTAFIKGIPISSEVKEELENEDEVKMTLIVAKNRKGWTGRVNCTFYKRYTYFKEID